MRRFNVTGLCIPEEDYMVDISEKIDQIRKLIDDRSYFTINRARQYGKTTMLVALERAIKSEFTVASLSFEGLGDESFTSPEAFCSEFMALMKAAIGFTTSQEEYAKRWISQSVTSFSMLSDHITTMCKDRKVVLLIDEVDKTSNNRVFLHFLSMLRNKFLARKSGKDFTFHSVILAGVYDIKNIKLKLIQEGVYKPSETEDRIYNSPWNIAVDFTVDMSFSPNEIASMLEDYENDYRTGMSIAAISEEIYNYTSGYPFLVSRICKCIDGELDKDWTPVGVQNAVKKLGIEKNTLFDDISKNLENNKKLYDLVYDILIVGNQRLYSINNPTVNLGVMYGIIKESNRNMCVSNKVFEMIICDYFISKDEEAGRPTTGVLQYDVVRGGRFDMELCLRKFAEHYAEIFSGYDVEFLERHGRLLFLSYLKPLVNGQGFYHLESQFTDLRRMDIVVDFGRQQFIVELKVWRGEQYQSEAYQQLCEYLESKHTDEGYLLTFDFRKRGNKGNKTEWIEVNDKRIFDVIV
jgi:hypothetical protein